MFKLLKRIRHSVETLSISRHEKSYNHLKYCFFGKKNSKDLIVSFSAFPGGGIPARYNYLKTLSNVPANRLFLLDDIYNSVNIGSYYLGSGGEWYLRDDVIGLIEMIRRGNNIEKVIMVGSSKGGTAALYFGLILESDYCIIGAPQYHIGTYLSSEKLSPILNTIMGDTTKESVQKLDALLKDEIEKERVKKPKVCIHYSPYDHTYQDHIIDMIGELSRSGYYVEEDNAYSYNNHGDIAKFFPVYLIEKIKEILEC